MSGRVDGKVAVVTGAASGIGLVGARMLTQEGARVVMMDLSRTVADRAREFATDGLDVVSITGDVGEEADVRATVARAVDAFGRLDIMWNNAAITAIDWIAQDTNVVEMPYDYFLRTLQVNVGGPFLGCKYAVPAMLASRGGSIINTTSEAGDAGNSVLCAYGTSKASVNYLTKSVAAAFGPQGIRCNAVAPGVIATPASDQFVPEASKQMFLEAQLVARVGQPEDIGNAVLYLASDEAQFVTGQVLHVDGGMGSHHPTLAARRKMGAASSSGRS